MSELKIEEFEKILNYKKCAFLCGNGFSMNFDNCFGNIYNNLYKSYKTLLHNSEYGTSRLTNYRFNSKCKENYNAVKDYLRNVSENEFYEIFNDGIKFAKIIVENHKLIAELKEKNLINNLVFGKSQLNLVQSIYEVGINRGAQYVNIENWPILIYFYFAIEKLNTGQYNLPKFNKFIKMIEIGNKSKIYLVKHESDISYVQEQTIFNGFNTFYRMLFSIAIFADGKVFELNSLDNIKKLKVDKIKELLNKFKVIFTLNYDKLIENIIEKEINHLHGSYVRNRKEYFYNQSLGMNYQNEYVSFSDILIGDYFVNKTMLKTIANLCKNKNGNKSTIMDSYKIADEVLKNEIDTIVLFGINIENDEDILRYIIIAFENAKVKEAKIIYCYYTEEERNIFGNVFKSVNKFSKELTQYGDTIKINYISTLDILKDYFYDKTI